MYNHIKQTLKFYTVHWLEIQLYERANHSDWRPGKPKQKQSVCQEGQAVGDPH